MGRDALVLLWKLGGTQCVHSYREPTLRVPDSETVRTHASRPRFYADHISPSPIREAEAGRPCVVRTTQGWSFLVLFSEWPTQGLVIPRLLLGEGMRACRVLLHIFIESGIERFLCSFLYHVEETIEISACKVICAKHSDFVSQKIREKKRVLKFVN